jgi:hypothetical protein
VTEEPIMKRIVIVFSVLCGAGLLGSQQAAVDAQAPLAALDAARQQLIARFPAPPATAIDAAVAARPPSSLTLESGAAGSGREFCTTHEGNPVSGLVAYEESPTARAMEGFVQRDRRGRRTRPWRALRRAEHRQRGVVVQRPLLVFMETPSAREDLNQPWFGPVRFDRPGFPTTKEKIAEQVFGKNFDHRDPSSMAGFYYRESGGRLIIKGDANSIHTVKVPHMLFDAERTAAAILAQLDPVVDFTRRADQFGWVDPVVVMWPYSYALDAYDPVMGPCCWIGYGPTVYDLAPAITNDALGDGTHAALSSLAISLTGANLGATADPRHVLFGMPEDDARTDEVTLYAHEYGHAIGLSHMMVPDYALPQADLGGPYLLDGFFQESLNRSWLTGFGTTIMNYAYGSGRGPRFQPIDSPAAGLDPVNRAKLSWGPITEVTLGADGRRVDRLAPGQSLRVDLVEHLGAGVGDPRPQILKVNLPPKDVPLFPRRTADGSPSGYWRPGSTGQRMIWSGRTFGGARSIDTTLRIPSDVAEPVLSFWTKYGAHNGDLYPPGYEFGWVQISTDHGRTWTTVAGQTSSTIVAPGRDQANWVDEHLGAPAFTGDSRQYAADGWLLEQLPLPVAAGGTVQLRFTFSGFGLANEDPSQDFGWWIDDVAFGPAADPARYMVSDFEPDDRRRWQGLLEEFDQGFGFVVVEETTPFPQAYFFELRGNNVHDVGPFTSDYPKDITGRRDDAHYTYEEGLAGYFVDYHASFWAHPYKRAGSATGRRASIGRLRRMDVSYPIGPQLGRPTVFDFSGFLAAAFTPNSGVRLGDLAFVVTMPQEQFDYAILEPGFVLPFTVRFPTPAISLLDATPTYRPFDVSPAAPTTPFPDRPSMLWPHILGAPGGWPKSVQHGILGLGDPTTVRALGQPFLTRDAAFHPDRNPTFDDRVDYRAAFAHEFAGWHAPTTPAAFGSPAPARRVRTVATEVVPVGAAGSIQKYEVQYCDRNVAGMCVPAGQAASRPWIEQMMYQRIIPLVTFTVLGGCPSEPVGYTPATKPAWDAYYTCLGAATDDSHLITEMMVDAARNLGQTGYPGLNAYGNQGTLSPGLWSAAYLDFWTRAKAPARLPSFGLSVRVDRITSGRAPVATLTVARN